MEYKDYYKTLGLSRDASADEIKKTYRRLARKYHPDVSTEENAEEKFKEVKEAYEVLKDPEKRKAYDQMGSNWQHGQGFQPPPDWEFHQARGQGFNQQGDFSDFFEAIFGGATRAGQKHGFTGSRQFKQRGQDQHSKIAISLEEAFAGTARVIQLREPVINPQTGQVAYSDKTLKVKIPAGAVQGQQIRLAGQGAAGMGGAANGDLYLEIQLLPHRVFTTQGHDVSINLPITPWEAALGSKVAVPTLGGSVELTIPAGSQTGQKLRLKGRGLPGKTAGDQYVSLKIYIPEPKTEQQKQLYKQMAEQMNFNPRQHLYSGGSQ